jgi:hypothetical protein
VKDLRAPDVHAVRWKVTHRTSGASVIVVERLWVDARTTGSRELQCDKNEVNCTRAEEE